MAATKKALTDDDLAEVIATMADGINLKEACTNAGIAYSNCVK